MVVLVLGPARSGTSAAAGVLHALGVHMGDQFDPPTRHHPKGSFTDPALLAEHLAMHGDRGAERLAHYAGLIAGRRADHAHWGVKDHALLPVLPHVAPVLGPTHAVVTGRNRGESSRSLLALRGGCGGLDGAMRYLARNDADIAAFLAGWAGPVLPVRFEEFQDPSAVVGRIAAFVGLAPTAEALAFPDPSLYRTVEKA